MISPGNIKTMLEEINFQGKSVNIIEFYNIAFIQNFKDLLFKLKDVNMRNYMTFRPHEAKFFYFSTNHNMIDILPFIHNEFLNIFSSPFKENNFCSSDILGTKRIRNCSRNNLSESSPTKTTPFSPFRFVQEQKFSKPKMNLKKVAYDGSYDDNLIIFPKKNVKAL